MASISGNNQIYLKGAETGHFEEGTVVTGTVYPGMHLIRREEVSAYGRDFYQAGSSDYVGTGTVTSVTTGGLKIVDINKNTGATVDDAYGAAPVDVMFIKPKPGDVLQVLVLSGQTVLKGSGLSAGTDGKFVVDSANPVLEALEASSGALAADTLVRAEVI